MSLTDFFRVSLPYGIARNQNGEWMAFNREYQPIGFNGGDSLKFNVNGVPILPIYTKYLGMTEEYLLKLGWGGEESVERDKDGKIVKVWLYNDKTNPRNQEKDNQELWDRYFEKLKSLASKDRC